MSNVLSKLFSLFSILTRWLRNFEKNYSYCTEIIWDNPILRVVEFFSQEISGPYFSKKIAINTIL